MHKDEEQGISEQEPRPGLVCDVTGGCLMSNGKERMLWLDLPGHAAVHAVAGLPTRRTTITTCAALPALSTFATFARSCCLAAVQVDDTLALRHANSIVLIEQG